MKKLLVATILLLSSIWASLAYTLTPTDLAIADRLEGKVEEMLASKPVEQRERIITALNILGSSPQFSPQMQALCFELSNRFYYNAQANNVSIVGNNNDVTISNINQQDSNNTVINNYTYYQYNETNYEDNNDSSTSSGSLPTTWTNDDPSEEAPTSSLSISRIDGLLDTTVEVGSSDILLYKINVEAGADDGVTISRLVININGDGNFVDNGSLTLYIDDEAVRVRTINDTTISFDAFSKRILAGEATTFAIQANLYEWFDNGSIQLSLDSIDAYEITTANMVTEYEHPTGATFTIE